jgi:ABC-type Fe3+/spermidine/putrescine transport system ATPase subunit
VGTLRGTTFPGGTPRTVTISIRPERIRVLSPNSPGSPDANHLSAKLIETTFLGEASEHAVEIDGHRLRATCSPPLLDVQGDVLLEIEPRDCLILPE